MITRTATITAIALLATLTACKGGGGGSTGKEAGKATLPVASRQSAEGIWFGKTDKQSPVFALVAPLANDKHEFHFAKSIGGFNYGPRLAGHLPAPQPSFETHLVKGGTAIDLRLEGSAITQRNLTARTSLRIGSDPIDQYTMTYSPQYDGSGALSRLVGNYSEMARKIGDFPHYYPNAPWAMQIDANGSIVRGHLPGCTITRGAITELGKGNKNLYRIYLTVAINNGDGYCLLGNNPPGEVALSGLASLVTLPGDTKQSLIFAAKNLDGSSLLAGSIPKQ